MTDPADSHAGASDTAPLPLVGDGPVEASATGAESPGAQLPGAEGPEGDEPVTTGTRRRAAGPGVVQQGGSASNGGAARRNRAGRAERRTRAAAAEPERSAQPSGPSATVTEVAVDDLLDVVEQGSAVDGFAPAEFALRPDPEPIPDPDGTHSLDPTAAVAYEEPDLVGRPALVGVPSGRRGARAGTIGAPSRTQVAAARRLQARKVGRLIRHVELWSLLKVALIFYLCMLVVGTIAGVIIWSALQRAGAVSSIEGFIESVFLVEDFRFEGGDIFRIGVLGGMVGVLVLTLLTVLGGLLFNLISDLTGGVRVSVVELESARAVPPRRRR